MKIDFHTHGKLAKKLPFSSVYTDWLFGSAKTRGLDALCLTEHFNTWGFAQVYEYISSTYEKDGDTFLCNGIRIFPGMETDIAEGGHVLCIGKMEDILAINRRLEPHKQREKFLGAKDLLDLFAEFDVIVGVGHPFRKGGHIPELPLEVLKKFDVIDMNGKDMAIDAIENQEKIELFSEKLGIPYVAGSDTHQAFQYACIYNEFLKECNTIADLRQQINTASYHIHISDEIEFQVSAATILKKALKEVHALGGDYVGVLTS